MDAAAEAEVLVVGAVGVEAVRIREAVGVEAVRIREAVGVAVAEHQREWCAFGNGGAGKVDVGQRTAAGQHLHRWFVAQQLLDHRRRA
ncbi:hypothetical protein FHR32_000812 [Streptosporangium album]|uniref:Uncharacterized protein n=1 Tax=Streptosporangium album TaxID=47479 RepID=A0A7W7W6Q2_9ACTN|nr:hypothetical protein [Streptosporangium album]